MSPGRMHLYLKVSWCRFQVSRKEKKRKQTLQILKPYPTSLDFLCHLMTAGNVTCALSDGSRNCCSVGHARHSARACLKPYPTSLGFLCHLMTAGNVMCALSDGSRNC